MFPNLGIAGGPMLVVHNNLWRYSIGTLLPLATGDEDDERENPFEAHFADWIELYHDGEEQVHLTDWSLTDSAGSPRKWVFPAGDGATDLAEYLAGTDPNNPKDFFQVDIAVSNSSTWVAFHARGAAGPGYDGRERR